MSARLVQVPSRGYLSLLDVPAVRDDDAGVSVSAQSACNRKRNLYFNWAQSALCNILLDFQTLEMMNRFLLLTLPAASRRGKRSQTPRVWSFSYCSALACGICCLAYFSLSFGSQCTLAVCAYKRHRECAACAWLRPSLVLQLIHFPVSLAQIPVLPLLQMTVPLPTLLRVLISSASSGDDKPAAFIKGGKTKTNHWLIRDLLWAWEVGDCLC